MLNLGKKSKYWKDDKKLQDIEFLTFLPDFLSGNGPNDKNTRVLKYKRGCRSNFCATPFVLMPILK